MTCWSPFPGAYSASNQPEHAQGRNIDWCLLLSSLFLPIVIRWSFDGTFFLPPIKVFMQYLHHTYCQQKCHTLSDHLSLFHFVTRCCQDAHWPWGGRMQVTLKYSWFTFLYLRCNDHCRPVVVTFSEFKDREEVRLLNSKMPNGWNAYM